MNGIVNVNVNANATVTVTVSESGEGSSDPSPWAFDSVHHADHETTMADATNVWVSSRQTFRQEAGSHSAYAMPAAP